MTTAHDWRRDSPVHEATPWARTPAGIHDRIQTERKRDRVVPLASFEALTGAGRHRPEHRAGTCLPVVPRQRPAHPVELETRPEPCRRCNDVGHFATVRLTADPDRDRRDAHQGMHEVCSCCAFEGGLYEEMRGQARSAGHVEVELRKPAGEWV